GTITFLIWGGYFLLVVGGSGYLMWRRADYTILYNVSPVEVDTLLTALFDRLNFPFTRHGGQFDVDAGTSPKSSPEKSVARSDSNPGGHAVLDVDGSALMRQVSLRWQFATPELRRQIEAELARDLERYEAIPGGVAGWLVTAAGSVMVFEVFLLATFLLVV